MSELEEVRELLVEIRDNQRLALERQEEHLEVAREQVSRSRAQVEESIQLQRQAVDRFRSISRIALPAIVLCLGLILYLVVTYF